MKKVHLGSRRGSAGFTLIELLVVVLIIGILASIAVPQYAKIVEKGRIAEALSCADTFNGAQERYYLKFNSYTAATNLDVNCGAALKFYVATVSPGASTWNVVFARSGTAPAPYSGYSFTYTSGNGALPAYAGSNTSVTTDLLPQ